MELAAPTGSEAEHKCVVESPGEAARPDLAVNLGESEFHV